MAATIALRAVSGMPSGFSFDASFTIEAGSSPNSRASSSIGLPAWYGAIARTCSGAGSSFTAFVAIVSPSLLDRIRTQALVERALLLQFAERGRDLRVVGVAFDVDVEVVLPGADARRPRLQARHRHAVRRQRLEHVEHRAGAVRHRQDQRRLVARRRSRWLRGLRAEHDEARPVVGIVLDVRGDRMQPEALHRALAG